MINVSSAYILALVVCAVVFLIAAFITNAIAYKPDMSDVKKRKNWFWVLGILTPVVGFILNYVIFFLKITARSKKADFLTAMAIAAGISLVAYIVAGFIASKISKTGKLSNWF